MTNATSDDNDVQCMQSTRIERIKKIKNNQRMSCRKVLGKCDPISLAEENKQNEGS